MRNNMVFVIFLLMFCSTIGFAGETPISFMGTLFDKETSQPVNDATITILNTNYRTISDKAGQFSIDFKADTNFTFEVNYIGYKSYTETVEIKGQSEVSRQIALQEQPIQLDEIVVTARGRESRLMDIPGSIAIVHNSDMIEGNPISISDAAGALPGITKASDMPWGGDIDIRGLKKEQVVFLVDGNRISTGTAIPAQFGTVAAQDIERMEILKGPISVLYGTGSLGGVVNAITRTGKFTYNGQWDMGLSSSYESVADGIGTYGKVGWNSSDYYFLITQSYREYQNYKTGGNEEVDNSQFKDYQTSVSMGLRLNQSNRIDGKYQYMEAKDVGIPGGGSQFPTNAIVSYPETRRSLYELAWSYSPNMGILKESTAELFYQPIQRRPQVIPNTVTTTPTKIVRPQSITPKADHDVMGFRWKNVMELGKNKLVAGMEGWQKEYTGSRTKVIHVDVLDGEGNIVKTVENVIIDKPLPDATYRPIGFYAENDFNLNQKLNFSFGGRIDFIHTENELTYKTYTPETEEVLWDENSDDDVSWSLQAGTVYNPVADWSLNFVVARAFRSPSLDERYQYIDLGSLIKLGDPELDPENSWFYEGGLEFRTNKFTWALQGFLNQTENLVIDAPGTYDDRQALIKTNAGKAKLYGVEGSANWVIMPKIMLSADVTYIRGKDELTDEDLPEIAPLTSHIRIRYSKNKGVWGETRTNFVAEQNKVALGEAQTPGYVTADIKIGYKNLSFGGMSHNFIVGIKNITDKKYKNHLTSSRGFELFEPGRSIFINWSLDI